MKRGLQLLRGTTWCSWAFKKLQPCGSHLTVYIGEPTAAHCADPTKDCDAKLLWWSVPLQASDLEETYSQRAWTLALTLCPGPPLPSRLQWLHCSSLTKTGAMWENLALCLQSVWKSVSCCMLGLNELLSVIAWGNYGKRVLALNDSCAFGTSLWVCKRLRVAGGIWSFSAWAYGTKVGTSFTKHSCRRIIEFRILMEFPHCRELYCCNPSGTKGLFLVWSVMNLAITRKGEHSSQDFWHILRVISLRFKKQSLLGLSLLWCLAMGATYIEFQWRVGSSCMSGEGLHPDL